MRLYYISAFLLLASVVKGQDIHFTQYFNAPLLNNPANAGNHDGSYRLISNYRTQWSSIGGTPYNTFNFNADKAFYEDKLAGAIQLYNDKSGLAGMSTTGINIIIGSSVPVKESGRLRFAIGSGYVQRTINYSELTWENQFTGTNFDKSLPTGETNLVQSYHYFDFSSGLVYTGKINSAMNFNSGLAFYHINAPKQNYLASNNRLYRRINAGFELEINIPNSHKIVQPSVNFNKQGKLLESVYGVTYRYLLGLDSHYTGLKTSSSVSLGIYYRTIDAFVVYWAYSYKNQITLGASYDINVSKLHVASQFRGGLEISLTYKLMNKKITVETVPSIE